MRNPTLYNPGVRIGSNEVVGGPGDGADIVTLTFRAEQLCAAMIACGVIREGSMVPGAEFFSVSWDNDISLELADKIRIVAESQTKKGR